MSTEAGARSIRERVRGAAVGDGLGHAGRHDGRGGPAAGARERCRAVAAPDDACGRSSTIRGSTWAAARSWRRTWPPRSTGRRSRRPTPRCAGGAGPRPSSLIDWFSGKTPTCRWSASSGSRRRSSAGRRRRPGCRRRRSSRPIPGTRERAVALLDDAIERFALGRRVRRPATLGDNLRFRLAQALADRADLEPAGSDGRRRREAEAMDLLEKPGDRAGPGAASGTCSRPSSGSGRETGRGRQGARRGPQGQAGSAGARGRRGQGPAADRPEAVSREAMQAVEASHLEAAVKGLWMVRIRLAELAGRRRATSVGGSTRSCSGRSAR